MPTQNASENQATSRLCQRDIDCIILLDWIKGLSDPARALYNCRATENAPFGSPFTRPNLIAPGAGGKDSERRCFVSPHSINKHTRRELLIDPALLSNSSDNFSFFSFFLCSVGSIRSTPPDFVRYPPDCSGFAQHRVRHDLWVLK